MVKYTSNVFFGVAIILCLLISLYFAIKRQIPTHRAWMIRGYAIGLGVSVQTLLIAPLIFGLGMSLDHVGYPSWAVWIFVLIIAERIIRKPMASTDTPLKSTTIPQL